MLVDLLEHTVLTGMSIAVVVELLGPADFVTQEGGTSVYSWHLGRRREAFNTDIHALRVDVDASGIVVAVRET